jgi:surface antigen
MLGADDYYQHAVFHVSGGITWDQWDYEKANCTSYCCEQAVFDMKLPPPLLGNGGSWAKNAVAQKIPVSTTPRLYDFAVFLPNKNGAGPLGHVALVTKVGNGIIDVAEYNFLNKDAYGTRQGVSIFGLEFVHYYKPLPIPVIGEQDMLIVRADSGDYLLGGGKMVGITTPIEDQKLENIHIQLWDIRGDAVMYARLVAAYPAQ